MVSGMHLDLSDQKAAPSVVMNGGARGADIARHLSQGLDVPGLTLAPDLPTSDRLVHQWAACPCFRPLFLQLGGSAAAVPSHTMLQCAPGAASALGPANGQRAPPRGWLSVSFPADGGGGAWKTQTRLGPLSRKSKGDRAVSCRPARRGLSLKMLRCSRHPGPESSPRAIRVILSAGHDPPCVFSPPSTALPRESTASLPRTGILTATL